MKFRTILSLASLFMVFFTVAVWSQPLPAEITANLPPDSQTIAGKISAIGDASFSVQIQKDKTVSTVEFQIDGNTKIEGKLAVGAQAAVEYKSDSGANVATHVVVSPAAMLQLY
jgi:hypothetical protein